MRRVLLLIIVLAFAFASAAGAADISGKWALKMKSPQGEDEAFTLAIAAKGGDLTITCSDHPKLTNLEGTGTLKGDAINMKLKATGDMAVEFTFTGTVAGNKMTGTREIGMSQAGGQGGAPGGEGGAPPGSEASAASAESGGPGGAPGGERGAAPEGERGAAGGERGAAPGGESSAASAESGGPGGAPGEGQGEVSDVWTAEKI